MAGVLNISCPQCDREMKAPGDGIGKKIRCKGCDHRFIIEDPKKQAKQRLQKPSARKKAPAKKGAPPPTSRKKKSPPPKESTPKASADGDSYGVEELDDWPRCPDCTNPMSDLDAVICLNCGYNIQTRAKVETRRTYETTGMDKFLWWLPGILCVVLTIALITYTILHWFVLPGEIIENWKKHAKEGKGRMTIIAQEDISTWAYFFHPGIVVWLVVFSGWASYKAGRFAVKRLIQNPLPPEVVKEKKKKGPT